MLLPILAVFFMGTSCSEVDFNIPVAAELWNCPPSEMEQIVTTPLADLLRPIEGVKHVQSITTKGKSTVYLQFHGSEIRPEEAKELVENRLKANDEIWRNKLPTLPSIKPMVREGETFLTLHLEVEINTIREKKQTLEALADSLMLMTEVLYVDRKTLPKTYIGIYTDANVLSNNLLTPMRFEGFIDNHCSAVHKQLSGKKSAMLKEQTTDVTKITKSSISNVNFKDVAFNKVARMKIQHLYDSDHYELTVQAIEGDADAIRDQVVALLAADGAFEGVNLASTSTYSPLAEAPSVVSVCFEGSTPEELAMQADKFCEGMSSANMDARIFQTAARHNDYIMQVNHGLLKGSRLSATDIYYTAANEIEGQLMGSLFLDGSPVEVRLFYSEGEALPTKFQKSVPCYLSRYDEYISLALGDFVEMSQSNYCDIHRYDDYNSIRLNLYPKDIGNEQVRAQVDAWAKAMKFPEGIRCRMVN